jgi:hypothetical protein
MRLFAVRLVGDPFVRFDGRFERLWATIDDWGITGDLRATAGVVAVG